MRNNMVMDISLEWDVLMQSMVIELDKGCSNTCAYTPVALFPVLVSSALHGCDVCSRVDGLYFSSPFKKCSMFYFWKTDCVGQMLNPAD